MRCTSALSIPAENEVHRPDVILGSSEPQKRENGGFLGGVNAALAG